jgi:hypothetical protein
MDVDPNLLDDEGIEDVSSDEEMYTRGDHMFVQEEDYSSDDEIDLSNVIAPAPGRLSEAILRPRSRSASSSSALSEAQEAPSSEDTKHALFAGSWPSKHGLRRGMRVDSRRATSTEMSDGDGEGDAEMSDGVSYERGSHEGRIYVGGGHVNGPIMIEDDDEDAEDTQEEDADDEQGKGRTRS